MNVKKFVLAWVVAFVVTFLLAVLWHLFLLADFYEVQSQALAREEPNMAVIIVGYLILGFLMALVYPIGYKGGSPVKEGTPIPTSSNLFSRSSGYVQSVQTK